MWLCPPRACHHYWLFASAAIHRLLKWKNGTGDPLCIVISYVSSFEVVMISHNLHCTANFAVSLAARVLNDKSQGRIRKQCVQDVEVLGWSAVCPA